MAFVQSVLDGLPSSSSTSTASSNAAIFGEIVVDMIWSIDVELEEIISDAKGILVNGEHGAESGKKLCYPQKIVLDLSSLQPSKPSRRQNRIKKRWHMLSRNFWLVPYTSSIIRKLSAVQAAGIIDATICRERLEMTLVANVGLIADKAIFEKKEIRTRTGLL